MGFLCGTFLRQFLTVLAVMLSRRDRGRLTVRDKHGGVPTGKVGSNRVVEGRAALEGLWQWQPACGGKDGGQKSEDGSVEPRNDLEIGPEA